MNRWGAIQIAILVLATGLTGCGRGPLGVPAIRDGGLDAIPDLTPSSPDVPGIVYRQSTQPFVQVSAGGGGETCGLKSDGSMLCWGGFGDFSASGSYGSAYIPRPPAEGWKQVSPAGGFTCGIKNDDTLACFGNAQWGNMQPPEGTYLAVDASAPCGLRLSDRGIVCWGSAEAWANPVPEGSFKALSIGGNCGCALRIDETVVCWGTSRVMAAMGETPDGTFVQVAVGFFSACGLRKDGQVVCWGSVKDWTGTDSRVAPQPQGTFVQISADAYTYCGVRTDRTLACWGMVDGFVPPEGSYLQVSVGSSNDLAYFCALRTDGIVVCWGGNYEGESSPP
jgi:hypothetical protein